MQWFASPQAELATHILHCSVHALLFLPASGWKKTRRTYHMVPLLVHEEVGLHGLCAKYVKFTREFSLVASLGVRSFFQGFIYYLGTSDVGPFQPLQPTIAVRSLNELIRESLGCLRQMGCPCSELHRGLVHLPPASLVSV